MSVLKHAGVILRELTRHILRRPVVGALAVARTKDGRVLLIRRGDSGKWALPGGTLEWSETLTKGLAREVEEETGATLVSIGSVRAIYSKPERDWRFHAVTVVVLVEVAEPVRGPHNPLEIREAKLFRLDEIPRDLDFDGNAVLDQALRGDGVLLELHSTDAARSRTAEPRRFSLRWASAIVSSCPNREGGHDGSQSAVR